jgi:FMN phosphatase YigB (HAD superfamily)
MESKRPHLMRPSSLPDAAPVMSALRGAGKAIGVLSDIHYDIRDDFVRDRLDPFVDTYVLSCEHCTHKPDVALSPSTRSNSRPNER